MKKIKTYKNIDQFNKKVLGLSDFDSWLLSLKNKLIKKIVYERRKKGLSQVELAQILGTTQSVISRLENGTSKSITLDNLFKILVALGTSPELLINEAAQRQCQGAFLAKIKNKKSTQREKVSYLEDDKIEKLEKRIRRLEQQILKEA